MKTNVLGININKITEAEILLQISTWLTSYQTPAIGHYITTVNPEIILKSLKNEAYRNIINQADLNVADGIGILWAAKFLSLKSGSLINTLAQLMVTGASLIFSPNYCQEILPERITGVDLMEKVCELAARKNKSVYLLGGKGNTAEKTAKILKKKYINLNIAGVESRPDFEIRDSKIVFGNTNIDLQTTIDEINQAQPDIVFVAFGAPKQDFFINECLLKIPTVKLALGVGGAFDFISGNVRRAPIVYRDLGLEWLFRLLNQPWRFFRIFNATVKFIYKVIFFKNSIGTV